MWPRHRPANGRLWNVRWRLAATGDAEDQPGQEAEQGEQGEQVMSGTMVLMGRLRCGGATLYSQVHKG